MLLTIHGHTLTHTMYSVYYISSSSSSSGLRRSSVSRWRGEKCKIYELVADHDDCAVTAAVGDAMWLLAAPLSQEADREIVAEPARRS